MTDRRKLVAAFEQRRVSRTRACDCLGISRRRLAYQPRRNDAALVSNLKELAMRHPRYGARQLRRKLLLNGQRVNLKRVRRLCRLHSLSLKARRRRKRRGIGVGMPCRAEYPNHVWAYDFVEDRTENGRKLRILTVVDEFTRRCIEVEVEHRMNARFVGCVLLRLFAAKGVPAFIRSDNGPEFIAKHLMRVLAIHGVSARHIDPGSPWQNGIDERFNGTLRDECLNLETFHGRDHARAVIKLYRREYNERRPHGSLGEAMAPRMFYESWMQRKQEEQEAGGKRMGALPPNPRHLALSVPPAGSGEANGLIEEIDQPASRMAIHIGAPVACQQSRILRVDGRMVTDGDAAETFPAANLQPDPKT